MVHSIHRFVRATIYQYFRTSLIRRSQFHTTIHKSQTQYAKRNSGVHNKLPVPAASAFYYTLLGRHCTLNDSAIRPSNRLIDP